MIPTHSGLSDTEYVYKSEKSHVHELCLQFGVKLDEVGMWLGKMYERLVHKFEVEPALKRVRPILDTLNMAVA